jgi:hypothetical protein
MYVHTNPEHHMNTDFKTYPWSSWQTLISNKTSFLNRKECFKCFGGKDMFLYMHENCKNEDFSDVLEAKPVQIA